MHEKIARLLLRIGHAEPHAVAADQPGVADLPAGLAVERRLVHHQRAGLAGF